MLDGAWFLAVLINLMISGAMVFVYKALRRRDAEVVRQARRDAEKHIRDAVSLSEQMYKVLSAEIQAMRRELEHSSAPAVVQTSNGQLDKRFHVLSLAARGLSLDEITEKIDIPKGEAELILCINRLKAAKGSEV